MPLHWQRWPISKTLLDHDLKSHRTSCRLLVRNEAAPRYVYPQHLQPTLSHSPVQEICPNLPLIRRYASQHQAADLLGQRLPDLEDALVRGDEQALAHLEAVDVAALEPPGDPAEPGELEVDGPAGLADARDVAHDGLVADVLEADPEAARGDVCGRDGLGLVREEGVGRRRLGPAARHARDQARPVQRQHEEEVVLCVGERGQPQARAGRVLQVGAGVCYVEDAHLGFVVCGWVGGGCRGWRMVEEDEEEGALCWVRGIPLWRV